MSVAASGIAPTATSSSSLPQIYLPSEEIDRRLEENERLLEEWKILFSKVNNVKNQVSAADVLEHNRLRRRLNDSLALLASQLKTFFATQKEKHERKVEEATMQYQRDISTHPPPPPST